MFLQYISEHLDCLPGQSSAFPFRFLKRHLIRTGARSAWIAPRGNAKTTTSSIECAAHAICYGLERYIVIFSATQPQATQIVRNLREELQQNERLQAWFSFSWQAEGEQAFTVNGIRVEGHGLRTARRGIKWGQDRPTWIILDDVEEDESVLSADQRRKTQDRFQRVIEPLGSTRTNLWVCGTLLHQEALLADLMQRPDFLVYFFRALEAEPKRVDLWEEYAKRYMSLDDPERVKSAGAFYQANRSEMDLGAHCLWPALESLEYLQGLRLTMGTFAFNAEKQNDPRNPETQVFFPGQCPKFRLEGKEIVFGDERIPLESTLRFGFLDPALGQEGGGAAAKKGIKSFAAYVTIAIDSKGRIFVLDAALTKDLPDKQISMCVDRLAVFGGDIGFEDVAFQRLLSGLFEAELKRRDIARPGVFSFPQHANKIARIMRTQPLWQHGWVILNESLSREFVAPHEAFPTGAYLDGPDALEGAIHFAEMRKALRFVR